MDLHETISTSLEALKRNRLRSFLTSLGIIIGVAAVILLISFGSGLQKAINQEFEKLGTNTIYVMPGKLGEGGGLAGGSGMQTNKLKFSDKDAIKRQVRNVQKVTTGIESITSVEYRGKKRQGVIFLATDPSLAEISDYKVIKGRFFTNSENESGKRVVVIGQTIAQKLMEGKNPLGQQLSVKGKKYTVVGMLEKLGSLAGQDRDNMVMLPTKSAERNIGYDRPTWLLIKATTKEQIPAVKKDIEKLLLKRLTSDDFTVLTQEETQNIAKSILGIVSAVFVGIAAISLLVGGIGISNIMLVSVTERTKEIGLRKAIGAKPRDILMQFLIEAIVLSVAGGTIGLFLAFLGTLAANFFIPATITPAAVILAFGFSVLVGIIFGVAPAIRASKLQPIVALRHE